MKFNSLRLLALLVLSIYITATSISSAQSQAPKGKPFVASSQYELRTIQGWKVKINKSLLDSSNATGSSALALLDLKLQDILRVVPEKAAKKLQSIPIWIGVNDGSAPCCE